MNNPIIELLDSSLRAVEDNHFDIAAQKLTNFVKEHPELVDERTQHEYSLIQKLMEYKVSLQDLESIRVLKWLYTYCQKKYATDEVCGNTPISDNPLPYADTIWWCWLQGIDNAPPIVKRCYESLEKLGRKIIILTEDNLYDYVEFPEHVKNARAEGKISNAHFSDLIRVDLLSRLGGCWIDATVLCTGTKTINRILENYPLFCYRAIMKNETSSIITYDSWFIYSSKPSSILTDTRKMLYKYWEQEDRLMHYFLFHIMFTLATWRHPEECAKLPIYSTEPCHIMQMEMFHPFSKLRYQELCDMSDIHKLTYKYDEKDLHDNMMLDYILKNKI